MENANKAPVMTVGKYKGLPADKLPVSYCRWLVGQKFPEDILKIARWKVAQSKTDQHFIDVTRHATDAFSKRFLGLWQSQAKKDEGIASFIARKAFEAYGRGEDVSKSRYEGDPMRKKYKGIIWVFSRSEEKVLITVMGNSDEAIDNNK